MPGKSNYANYGLKQMGNNRLFCLLVCDWFYWDVITRRLCRYCARCTIIAFHFNENIYNAVMLLLQLLILHITSLDCPYTMFQKSLRGSAFDNYHVRITILCLHFIITYQQNNIVTLKSNAIMLYTTWARESVSESQLSLRAVFAHSCRNVYYNSLKGWYQQMTVQKNFRSSCGYCFEKLRR